MVVITGMAAPPRDVIDHWSKADQENFAHDVEQKRLEVLKRLHDLKLSLTPWEQAYFAASAATMSAQQQFDATWRLESFQVLAWALGAIDKLPTYDSVASTDVLKAFPIGDTSSAILSAKLRPKADIDRGRDAAELWHWRSRTRQLVERGDPFPGTAEMRAAGIKSYDDVIRLSAKQAAKDGVTTVVDDDFSLRGKAYRNLTADEWAEVDGITQERHFAFNWLCGYAPQNHWDETPTDT